MSSSAERDSNPRINALQAFPLATWVPAHTIANMLSLFKIYQPSHSIPVLLQYTHFHFKKYDGPAGIRTLDLQLRRLSPFMEAICLIQARLQVHGMGKEKTMFKKLSVSRIQFGRRGRIASHEVSNPEDLSVTCS